MKRFFCITFTILLIAVIGLVSCAKTPEVTPSPTPTAAPSAWEWPSNIIIGTSGIGSTNYAETIAWASVLQQDTGTKIRVVPFEGDPTRLTWVNQGSLDATVTSAGDMPSVIQGTQGTATKDGGPFQVRVLWLASISPGGFMVRADSDIKTIYDIKPGTRVAMCTVTPATVIVVQALLAWLNLTEKDVQIVPFGGLGR